MYLSTLPVRELLLDRQLDDIKGMFQGPRSRIQFYRFYMTRNGIN